MSHSLQSDCATPPLPQGWRRVGAWLLALLLVHPLGADQLRHHYEVKAALFLSFTTVVKWPDSSFADPKSPFVIGVLGKDPFGNRLEEVLHEKRAQGRAVSIVRIHHPREALQCHILFFGSMDEPEERQAMSILQDKPILTIGETDEFWANEGAIQFIRHRNKVHFRINLDATTKAGLKVDPNLLKVAREVKDNTSKPTTSAKHSE